MITQSRKNLRYFWIFIAITTVAVLAACSTPTPIVIFVTPTPGSASTAAATRTVLITPSPAPTQLAPTQPASTQPGPTLTSGTFGPLTGPNTTPYVPPPSSTPTAVSGSFGAVVGPDTTPYVPPPTNTPTSTGTNIPATIPVTTPTLSPTPGPVLRADLMGIQIHSYLSDSDWQQRLGYAKALGVGWVKIQLEWRELEPSKGFFNAQYKLMVLHVQQAHLQGFHTLVSIAKAPGWARPAGITLGVQDGPSDNPQDFADFVAQFIRDCKPEFIDAVEVWNEPNLIREWEGKPLTGTEYMKYFRAAYAVIQAEDQPNHRITVITAGPAPTDTVQGSTLNDREWLRQIYASGLAGMGSDIAVGAHPYSWANAPSATCCTAGPGITGWFEHRSFYFKDTIDDYRAIMQQNNHTQAKLWITEFGWSTFDGLQRNNGSPVIPSPDHGWQALINQGQQANYVLQAFYMAQQPPYSDFVGPMMLWNLDFAMLPDMVDQGREESAFSLLDTTGRERPVFTLLKNAPKQ